MVTGVVNNNNEIPSLEEEMVTIAPPKVAKHQPLTKSDCGNAIDEFVEKSAVIYSASLLILRTKQKLTTAAFCFNF
jgi:hypothetical protein